MVKQSDENKAKRNANGECRCKAFDCSCVFVVCA